MRISAQFPTPFCLLHTSEDMHLGLLVAEDIRVTGIEDGHGRRAEGLTAGVSEINLRVGYACK